MALRKVLTLVAKDSPKTAIVYRDSEWQEFRVVHWDSSGVRLNAADYHCDTNEEAVNHAYNYINGQE